MSAFLRDAGEFLPILLLGVKLTIIVTIGSLALSTLLGLIWALMRVSGVAPFVWTSKTVVKIGRAHV